VKIKASPPGCGDTLLQPGEQCDDGDNTPGDGCDAACQAEPPHEIEPNATIAAATPPWAGFGHWIAAISPAGDHDYFQVTLSGAGTVTFATHSVGNPATCPEDTVIHLLDGSGAQIQEDDDAGADNCSMLSAALPAGTYYLWVEEYQDALVIPAYQLDFSIQ
jgi:cysteine-rich repeat protein